MARKKPVKRMSRAEINFEVLDKNEHNKSKDELIRERKFRELIKKSIIGENGELTWADIDNLICRAEGYSERIFKHGSNSRLFDLYSEVHSFYGIKEVREVFRRWITAMNLTIATVSNALFPDKSSSYLSTMLNPDNAKTYSDQTINEAFITARKMVDSGALKIDGETIQDKALRVADVAKPQQTECKKPIYVPVEEVVVDQTAKVKRNIPKPDQAKTEGEKMNHLIITNFKTKKQEVVNIGQTDFKVCNDFFTAIKNIMGVNVEDITIIPIINND